MRSNIKPKQKVMADTDDSQWSWAFKKYIENRYYLK